MRIGINGNRLVATGDLATIVDHASGVAGAGLDSYWLAQHPAGAIDSIAALAAVGTSLPDLALGTGVVPIWGRHPAALAAQILTSAQSIGGGLTVGLGLSHPAMVGAHLGSAYHRPMATIREYLSVLGPLLSRGEVDHVGELFTCQTKVPIVGTRSQVLLAAMGSQMLDVAGRLADGTIVSWTGPKTIRDHVIPTITQAALDQGRDAPRIAAIFSVCVTDDATRARAAIHEWFEYHGKAPSYEAMIEREGVESASDVAIVGNEAEVTERIAHLATLGVTDLVVGEALADDERTRSLLGELARGGVTSP